MNRPSTLVGRLTQHAEAEPKRCAVISRTESWSFAELLRRVNSTAERLEAAQVGADSVVGIDCEEDSRHLVLCLAIAHLGATSFTVPSYESAQQHEGMLHRTGASFIVRGDLSLERPLSAELVDRDSLLSAVPGAKLLFSTSGTTGEPKIVCQRDSGLVAQAHRHVGPNERFACLASMEHNFAKRHRLYCVAQGATNTFVDASAETFVEECRALKLTTLHVSAFQAQELLAVPGVARLRDLRLKLGGSHVPAALRAQLRASVTDHLECGYGTTETGAIGFTDPVDEHADESVGRALPGIEIRVVDAERATLGEGERGEVSIRCEGMFMGYLGDPRRTSERLEGGWFYTGDVGSLDDHGRLHLGGRADDMFVFNSINIHPQELEAQIREHSTVLDAVVLAQRSPVHGDVPVAFVVQGGPGTLDLRELKSFVRERAGMRCPRRFTVVDRIPRNPSGKILRDEARALLLADQDR